MNENPQVIVVGGGASGLTAGNCGGTETVQPSLILEQNENPGRKICVTGNGRCNLTNKDMRPGNIFVENTRKLYKNVLKTVFHGRYTGVFWTRLGVACY